MADVPPLFVPLALFAALVAGAAVGAESGRRALLAACKPTATLVLLAVVGVPPEGRFAWLIAGGLALSAAGDVALLGDSERAFLAGMALFLVAHVLYAAAFIRFGRLDPAALAACAGVVLVSALLVREIWFGAGSLRPAVLVYAVAVTSTACTALATLWGPLPIAPALATAAGACAFYLSDANLAWRRFRGDDPHAHTVTLVVYWAGQLGIALGARWAPS